MDLTRILGANWRTTLTGWLEAATGLLTLLAAAPYELGELATILPPEHKAAIFKVGLAATFILRLINRAQTKDAAVKDTAQPPRTPLLGLALLAALPLAGCSTTADGRTQWDPHTTARVVQAVLNVFEPTPAPAPVDEPRVITNGRRVAP